MTEKTHAIAVDAGGTSTRAVVVDADGNALTEARGGTGNPRAVGNAAAAQTIAATCREAATAAGVDPAAIVVTAAGVLSLGGEFPGLAPALAAAGLGGSLRLEPDLVSAYFSATSEPTGRVLIVGTGATAARIGDGRVTDVRDGLGWLLGDDGSGFWIGSQVARAVAAHLDHRGQATSLTDAVVTLTGNTGRSAPGRDRRLVGLVDWVYGITPVTLSSLAVLAAREAGRGDAVANRICDQAAERILATLAALPGGDGPTAVGGSVLGEGSPVADRVLRGLGDALRVSDGVVGSALLAVGALGGDTGPETHARITASLAALRSTAAPVIE